MASKASEFGADSEYIVVVSKRFSLWCLICGALVSFSAGRMWRGHLLDIGLNRATKSNGPIPWEKGTLVDIGSFKIKSDEALVHDEDDDADEDEVDEEENDGSARKAQHLLVDYHHIDGFFLSSKTRLMQAAKDFFLSNGRRSKIVYQVCLPMREGWDCTILLHGGNRLSLTSWPLAGIISMDIFWSEEHVIERDLELIDRYFAHPRNRHVYGPPPNPPTVLWAVKSRDHSQAINNIEKADLSFYVTGSMWQRPWKKQIASVQTTFQRVDIYEMWNRAIGMTHHYHEKVPVGVSGEQACEDLRPDRMVFLDGVIQSRLFGEAAYHEALVHPALFAHPYPRRVAIIGGGEGATLREVLKHRSVEKVTMIDIDYEMVMVSREYLPEWCDCSNLVGSASWCGDDPRAELFYEDAIQWFISRYGDGRNELEPYDVIIMDALDPDSAVPFSDTLYDNAQFVEALSTALNPDGIMIMQTGAGSDDEELPIEYSKGKNYERLMINHMRNNGFVDHITYEESSAGFMENWGFSLLFKSWKTRNRWFSSSASIDLELRKRAISTKNGESPFRFFDGATMMLYQESSLYDEVSSCLKKEVDEVFCRYPIGFDEGNENIPLASLSALVDNEAQVRITTRQDIPEGAYVALESGVDAWEISAQALQMLETTSRGIPTERFKTNLEQLGSPTCLRGGRTLFVDTNIFGLVHQEDYGAQSFNIGLNDTDLKNVLTCPFDVFANVDRDAYARRVRFQHSATAFIPAGSVLERHQLC